ncbi:MAG TPA: HAMP domain-containing sensor histidine kinase [Acidimicrobiales bacterium]|nr:HAMP domain-containing sensor histidine kinase [Acidimicrobiales bacterium]
MTFRTRLVMAATIAVLLAVVVGSISAYVVAHNSLVGSIDNTLSQDGQSILAQQSQAFNNGSYLQVPNFCSSSTVGECEQVVYADGSTSPLDPQVLPINDAVKRVAGSGGNGSPVNFSSVLTNGKTTTAVRETVIALPGGWFYHGNSGIDGRSPLEETLPGGGALQLTLPLTGVNQELGHLAIVLWIIALLGVALAVLLGLAVGRAVLGPLNSLTFTIEELAETTDVSKRLDPGGMDELGRLRRAFNRLLTALDSSRDAQRQLVLDASHELRTPLTSLRTNMEVARRMDELEPAEREVLIGDVLTQLDELTTVVADLAELARGEQPPLTSEPVALHEVVEEAVGVATTHGRSRNVTFAAFVVPTWVLGSRPRIERAVGNLLDNALKWSPDGGSVEITCSGGTVIVRDHGPGIEDADLDHLFDRFYRAPNARGLPGSGLGLAIVAQVAREEGGSVTAQQAPGGGALFRFTLPEIAPPEATGVDQ